MPGTWTVSDMSQTPIIGLSLPTLAHWLALWAFVPAWDTVETNCVMACDAHGLGSVMQNLGAA